MLWNSENLCVLRSFFANCIWVTCVAVAVVQNVLVKNMCKYWTAFHPLWIETERRYLFSKKFLDNIEHLHWLGYILEKVVKKCNVAANFPLTRSILGWWIGLAIIPYRYVFQQLSSNFHTFSGHLWKVAKVQKFALLSSEAHVSARVGLALVADQTSACRFARTLPSCNPQCFKYSWKF